jgi:hypothetical protein
MAKKEDPARRGNSFSCACAQQSAFPRTIAADEPHDRASDHFEIKAFQN